VNAGSDLILQIEVATLGDTAAYVAWLDESPESYRLWGAVADLHPSGLVTWRPGEPELLAREAITSFHLLVAGGATGIAYTVRGHILYRPDIRKPRLTNLNADSDYVRAFGAYRSTDGLRCVAIVSNLTDSHHITDAVVAYHSDGTHTERQRLADATLTLLRSSPMPSIVVVHGTLRAIVGLDHGTFTAAVSVPSEGALSFMAFSAPLLGLHPWSAGRSLQVNLGAAYMQAATEIRSLAAVPADVPALLTSNGGTCLVTWGGLASRPQVADLSNPDASGDDIGQLQVTASREDSTHLLLAWIDAERQMARRSEAYAHGVNPSTHGGDIMFAVLGSRTLALRRSKLSVLLPRATAECIALSPLRGATLVAWGGPRWPIDRPVTSRPEERIFCQTVPDSLW